MNLPIYIASSRWLIAICSAFYCLFALALWLSSCPWWLCLLVYIVMLCDLHYVIKKYGLRMHKTSVATIMQDCDQWRYQLFNGKEFKGDLVKERCYKSSWLLVIVIRAKRDLKSNYVIIPRDALSEHNFRMLRLRMAS